MSIKREILSGTANTGYNKTYEVTGIDAQIELVEVLMKFASNISKQVQVLFNSRDGASYDVLLKAETLVAAQDFRWSPEGFGVQLFKGDAIDVRVTSGSDIQAYTTLNFREI